MSIRNFLIVVVLSLSFSVYVGLSAMQHAKERLQLRHQQLERTLATLNQ